jgi:hypothetical protein
MAKPSKKTIQPLVDEWGKLNAQAQKIEDLRDAEIKILKDKFDRQCATIRAQANEKLEPIQKKLAALVEQIEKPLLAGVADDGTIDLPQVIGERAFATVNRKDGPREIDPVKFFEHTPPAKRDPVFWGCVKIAVAPAEKLVGKVTLDTMSNRNTKHEVELKMKKS